MQSPKAAASFNTPAKQIRSNQQSPKNKSNVHQCANPEGIAPYTGARVSYSNWKTSLRSSEPIMSPTSKKLKKKLLVASVVTQATPDTNCIDT